MAGPLAPPYSIESCVVDKSSEDKFCGLVSGRLSKDGYGEGKSPESVPADGDIVKILQQVHSEGVD